MSTSKGGGTVAYKDPLCFKGEKYRRGKKSDIFGLGVILWELSSGQNPCDGCIESHEIVIYRLRGSRDKAVLGTSEEYIKLYSECWHENPDKRPFCEEVHNRLDLLKKHSNADNGHNKSLEIEQNDTSTFNTRE